MRSRSAGARQRTDGITNLGQSSPAKPAFVHVVPMSTTIAETSSAARAASPTSRRGHVWVAQARSECARPRAAAHLRRTSPAEGARGARVRRESATERQISLFTRGASACDRTKGRRTGMPASPGKPATPVLWPPGAVPGTAPVATLHTRIGRVGGGGEHPAAVDTLGSIRMELWCPIFDIATDAIALTNRGSRANAGEAPIDSDGAS